MSRGGGERTRMGEVVRTLGGRKIREANDVVVGLHHDVPYRPDNDDLNPLHLRPLIQSSHPTPIHPSPPPS